MEDAEEYYSSKSKENEEEFLKEVGSGKNMEKAEKDFIKRSKKTRKSYEGGFKSSLKKEKWSPKKKKKKKEEDKKFIVEKINLEETQYDKIKRSLASKSFHAERKLSEILRGKFFNIFRYLFYRTKYFLKSINQSYRVLRDKMSKRWSIFKTSCKERFNKTKAFLKKIKEKLKSISSKKKKGKKDGKNDKEETTDKKEE